MATPLGNLLLSIATDNHGFFESKLGMAPDSWPWALRVHYAVNFGPAAQRVPLGASAAPNGETSIAEGDVVGGRVELIGFWQGGYAVVQSNEVRRVEEARRIAEDAFADLRIRFLLETGEVIRINDAVDVTGDWPEVWTFDRLSDLGVFCAFVYEEARAGGASEEATASFKASIWFAWPQTELLVMYLKALEGGRSTLSSFLTEQARRTLDEAISRAQRWLAREP